MMKRFLIAGLLVLAAALPARAQSSELRWDYLATTPAVVATYTHSVQVDGTVQAGQPTCVARGADTTCTMPIPSPGSTSHVYKVTTILSGNAIEAILNYNPANAPKPPANGRIVVIIIIGG